MKKHPALFGVAGGVVGTILIAIAVWLTITYTGAYNVAASDQHFDAIRWTLDTTMHRSVENRTGIVELPQTPPDDMLAEGARHYAESCAHCHGGPGQEPSEWSRGMRPEPPHLTEAAAEWTGQEIHWIVSNGIKMTGMPAFGEHHSTEEISSITAFVTTLPGLSADDYSRLTAKAQDHSRETQSSAEGDAHGELPADASPSRSD